MKRELFAIAFIAGGCRPDSGLIDPRVSFASTYYSDWSEPVNLGPVINGPYNDQHPALSKDGLSLFFASTRPASAPPTFGCRIAIAWIAHGKSPKTLDHR